MATHFVYLTNSVLVSLVARRRRIVERHEHPVSEAGAADFDRRLAAVAHLPTHLITELAEEDFRTDTIPHVGARDRAAIVARRLGQMFRNTPYRHALVQGREPEGRRDDRVVYTAITNPEVVRPWLEMMERLEVPLVGVHSAAVLGTRLGEVLALAHDHVLLVLLTAGGALRQTYIRRGELRFTRLTPIDLEEGRTLGEVLAEETTRTWQYLDNLRSFQASDRLHVMIVAHPHDVGGIRAHLQEFDHLVHQVVDTAEVAKRIGLAPPPRTSSAEEILVHLFLRRAVENHFASSEMRRFWTLRMTRNVLTMISVGAVSAGLVFGGLNLAGIVGLTEAAQRVERDVFTLNQAYDQIARTLPSYQVGSAAIRDAVAFYSGVVRDFPSPGDFIVPLSGALEAHPIVRLTQLSWQATDDAKAMPAITTQVPRVPPPVKALARGAEAAVRPTVDDASSPPLPGGRYEVALLEAIVTVPSHDFRRALAEVEALAADIGRIEGYRAEVVESPLDVRPSLALQGRHAEREPGSMESRFLLRVVRTRGKA